MALLQELALLNANVSMIWANARNTVLYGDPFVKYGVS